MTSPKGPQSLVTSAPPLLWEVASAPATHYLSVASSPVPGSLARSKALVLPEHSELQVVRHFKALSQANFSIDRNMYPLGSCTMKYNPKIAEAIAALPEFIYAHPARENSPSLAVLSGLQDFLGELTGLPGVSLQPAAGAQGELAGVLIIRAALEARGELGTRNEILIPDSAHGTNPATTTMAGFVPITLKSGPSGKITPEIVRPFLGPKTAGIMITNPSTLGLFEDSIRKVARLVHEAGGYVYGDGANFNAIAGVIKPGDYGIDIMHINVHKTFGTPHGGGGPGAGPICVIPELSRFLPGPVVEKGTSGNFEAHVPEASIGRLKTGWGNFGVLLRAYSYLISHGIDGIRKNSIQAVLSANYLMKKLEGIFPAAYPGTCMHEYVAENPFSSGGVHTLDIAKRLLDFGIHAPTVYFPLIVKEAIMIEPTESESLEELDRFVEVLEIIAQEAAENPAILKNAPNSLPLGRVDEVLANRKVIVKHNLV